MDDSTVAAYERGGVDWAAKRLPVHREDAIAFGRAVRSGGLRLDLGAGGGTYTNDIGEPAVALDAARSMLGALADVAPRAMRVQADLEALPFRRGSLAGCWANMAYVHVRRERCPMALADLHRTLEVGAVVEVSTRHGELDGTDPAGDSLGGRYFAGMTRVQLDDLLVGAGFDVVRVWTDEHETVRARATRARSLADTVAAGMRLLVCGLNPSEYSADRGVGYARPTNRFWAAAVAAGLVTKPFDAIDALRTHGVGITDLCKRATVASAELTNGEYARGAARVERLVRWLRPGAVVFVGLEGFRAAVDRRASTGPQPGGFGGRPAYVMPSTSGRVPARSIDGYVEHLRAALALSAPE